MEGKKKSKNYYVSESVGIACGVLLAAIQNAGLVAFTGVISRHVGTVAGVILIFKSSKKPTTNINELKKIYSYKILEKNIEDEKGNVTRFLIMGKNIEQPEFSNDKKFITSCIFRVKSEPSALYKCLGGFATNQVNLTKLESFSVKNSFDQANFYLDLEGHIDQPGVKKALEELGFHTENLDILGVYEASTFRQK